MNERPRIEYAALRETLQRSDRAWLLRASPDRLLYEVELEVRTLVKNDAGRIAEEERVVGVLYHLHERHPLQPPLVVLRQRDLFNTHVADPRAGFPAHALPFVCLGTFRPQLRLADWVVATYDVLRWKKIATESYLNAEAAAFARRELRDPGRFPLDLRGFWQEAQR